MLESPHPKAKRPSESVSGNGYEGVSIWSRKTARKTAFWFGFLLWLLTDGVLKREPWDVFPWLYLTALILFGVVWGLFAEKSRLRHDVFAWPAWMVLGQFAYALVFGHSDFSMGPLALVMFAVTGIPAAIGLCIGRFLRSKE